MSSLGYSFAAIVFLLAANAFFVAAEFAPVMKHLERLPDESDAFEVAGLKFSVARMSRRQVQTALISKSVTRPSKDTGNPGKESL